MVMQSDFLMPATMFPVERQRGIRNAADKAGNVWLEDAAFYLGNFARTVAQGCEFLVEDAIAACPHSLRPENPKAWGAAVLRAKGDGRIGYATHPDGARKFAIGRVNASPKPLWVAA
jgi:hypothetical protein